MTAAYDSLLSAYVSYASEDSDAAGSVLDTLDTSLLSKNGKKSYIFLSESIMTEYLENTYELANKSYNRSKLTEAKEYYGRIIALDESYDDGNALYNLAQCHRKLREYEEAYEYYKKVAELFPDTSLADNAAVYMRQLEPLL